MRNLLILILGAAVVWLLIERNRLTNELAASATQLTEVQSRVDQGRSLGGSRKSWLDDHIDRGAKALQNRSRR